MIARLWSAQTTPAQAPAYAEHLKSRVLPELTRLEGYAGAMLLERNDSGSVEILVITLWQSLGAIHSFAGSDPEAAVVADEAVAVLTEFDRRVRHYELVLSDRVAPQ